MEKQKNEIRQIYIYNVIASILPVALAFFLLLFIMLHYSVLDYVTCYKVKSIEEMNFLKENQLFNIQLTMEEIKYTGYDYYEDGKLKGAYYYGFLDDSCVFFLIETDEPEETLSDYTVKGKMLANNPSLETVLNQFALDTGLSYDTMAEFSYPLLVSEIDYPLVFNVSIRVLVVIPFLAVLVYIGFWINRLLYPEKSGEAKKLLAYGDPVEVMNGLNEQIKSNLVFKTKGCYITEEYMISYNLWKIDVIRIQDIQFISKHIGNPVKGLPSDFIAYKITMSNKESMFYERKFFNQKTADEIMETIISLCPNLKDSQIDEWLS